MVGSVQQFSKDWQGGPPNFLPGDEPLSYLVPGSSTSARDGSFHDQHDCLLISPLGFAGKASESLSASRASRADLGYPYAMYTTRDLGGLLSTLQAAQAQQAPGAETVASAFDLDQNL